MLSPHRFQRLDWNQWLRQLIAAQSLYIFQQQHLLRCLVPEQGVAEGAEERRSRGPGEPARPDRDAQREVVGLRVAAVVDEATYGLCNGVWCCRHHESFYRICYRIDALEAACCGAPHLSKACGCCLGCASAVEFVVTAVQ